MALANINIAVTIDQSYLKGLQDVEKNVNQTAKNIQQSFTQNLGSSVTTFGKSITAVSKQITDLGAQVSKVSLPIGLALVASTKAFVDFEDQLATVGKVTGLTGQQLKTLGEGILELSANTRTSIPDLLQIAQKGGQLGVASKDILSFTHSVDVLNVALGTDFLGGAEEVTTAVTGLRNIFHDIKTDNVADDILHIGNALNVLSLSGLATAPVITDIATRIGGLAGPLGVSSANILGLSATLQDLNVNAERGGSSVGRIFQELAKNSENFATQLGINVTDFKNLVNRDINQALLVVLKRVGDMNLSATELANLLDALNINGVGSIEVFQKLATNTDLLTQRQQQAGSAIKETGSLLSGFEQKNATTAASIAKLGNQVQNLGILIGSVIVPFLNQAIGVLVEFTDKVTSAFSGLSPLVQNIILGVAAFIAILGPAIILIGQLGQIIGVVTTAIGGFITVLGSTATPVILAIGLIVALGSAIVVLADKFGVLQKIGFFINQVFDLVKTTIQNIIKAIQSKEVQTAIQNFQNSFSKLLTSIKPIFDAIIELINSIQVALDLTFGESDNTVSIISLSNAITVLTKVFDILNEAIKAITPIFQGMSTAIKFVIDDINGWVVAFTQAFQDPEVIKAIDQIKVAFESIKPALEELRIAFVNLLKDSGLLDLKINGISLSTLSFSDKVQIAKAIILQFVAAIDFAIKVFKLIIAVIEIFIEINRRIVVAQDQTREAIARNFGELVRFITAIPKQIEEFARQVIRFFTVVIPSAIARGISNTIKSIQLLPKTMFFVGLQIGIAIGTIINFFTTLPNRIQFGLSLFARLVIDRFNQVKDSVILKVRQLYDQIVTFFQNLPGAVLLSLAILGSFLVAKFNEYLNLAIIYFSQIFNNIVSFFAQLPGRVGNELGILGNLISTSFNNLLNSAFNFGQGLINNIVAGIKSVANFVGDTITNLFKGIQVGIGISTQNKSEGGVIGFAEGGLVPQMANLLSGIFKTSGTDTVPAMLTPGELVIPRDLTSQLFSLLRQVSVLPSMPSSSRMSGVNVNINQMNASTPDEGRRRGGDLGFGLYANLRAKGIT